MNPMIKYRGGKSKELCYFLKHIPVQYNTYIEPFVGGGALYFYLEPENAIINDVNDKLYSFYKEIRDKYPIARQQLDELQVIYEENQKDYEELKKKNSEIKVENKNEALYYRMRNMFNHKISCEYLESVIYFFINKTAYSGMIRYNAKGEYNVPFGRYKNFNTHLLTTKHCKLLKKTQIYNHDYSEIFNMAGNNDFMFLDPPYDCVFSDYGNETYKNGFGEDEHRRLANDFKNLPCQTLMIIGATDLTRELYTGYVIDEYGKKYNVNIKNRFQACAKHLIVANYQK